MPESRFRLNCLSCTAPSCHVMHAYHEHAGYFAVALNIASVIILVFCFFADKTLSWCEIRQILRMCTSSLLFRRAPLLCFLFFSFALLYSSLMLRCFSISTLYACYLAASYYPFPHPITIVCLPVSMRVLGMLSCSFEWWIYVGVEKWSHALS